MLGSRFKWTQVSLPDLCLHFSWDSPRSLWLHPLQGGLSCPGVQQPQMGLSHPFHQFLPWAPLQKQRSEVRIAWTLQRSRASIPGLRNLGGLLGLSWGQGLEEPRLSKGQRSKGSRIYWSQGPGCSSCSEIMTKLGLAQIPHWSELGKGIPLGNSCPTPGSWFGSEPPPAPSAAHPPVGVQPEELYVAPLSETFQGSVIKITEDTHRSWVNGLHRPAQSQGAPRCPGVMGSLRWVQGCRTQSLTGMPGVPGGPGFPASPGSPCRRQSPGRDRSNYEGQGGAPRTATPKQDWLCLPHPRQPPAPFLSPSRPQHPADQLPQAALEDPGETARGRSGTVGSQQPLFGKWRSLPLRHPAPPPTKSSPLIHWGHGGP